MSWVVILFVFEKYGQPGTISAHFTFYPSKFSLKILQNPAQYYNLFPAPRRKRYLQHYRCDSLTMCDGQVCEFLYDGSILRESNVHSSSSFSGEAMIIQMLPNKDTLLMITTSLNGLDST